MWRMYCNSCIVVLFVPQRNAVNCAINCFNETCEMIVDFASNPILLYRKNN